MAEEKRRRWWRWPLAWAWMLTLGVVLVPVFDYADYDPLFRFAVQWVAFALFAVGVGGLIGWLLFRSGLSARWRLAAGLLLAAGVAAFLGSLSGFDVTGDFAFVPRFRWQTSPSAALERDRVGETDAGLPPVDATIDTRTDFPRFRGLAGDGLVQSVEPLANDWKARPPAVVWRRPCGGGFAGFAVAGNVAVTVEQRRGDEVIVCYDRDTGKERWAYAYAAHFRDPTGDGPRATPTVHAGLVYSLGGEGDLVCVEAKTGAKQWAANVLTDAAAKRTNWGAASSPLVFDGRVIINAGIDPAKNAGRAVLAYDARTGALLWAKGRHPAGYSSPTRLTVAGRDQVVLFDGGGLAGVAAEDGEELWRVPWKTFQDMNTAQPLLLTSGRLLISSEPGNGCAAVEVTREGDGFRAAVAWENRYLGAKQSSPVALNQSVFGLSNGTLVCLDALTGARLWRGKHYGHGQLLAVDGHVIVLGEYGEVALVAGDRRAFRELGRLSALGGRTWNTPALAGGRLFVRNDKEMACLELPARE